MTNYENLNTKYWGTVVPNVQKYNEKHGTKIKPWHCVKWYDDVLTNHPRFAPDYNDYEFYVVIIDGKPLFSGDIIYEKATGIECIVKNPSQSRLITISNREFPRLNLCYSVEEMEKQFTINVSFPTFTLNGKQYPKPTPVESGYFDFILLGEKFKFKNRGDAKLIYSAILDIIKGN